MRYFNATLGLVILCWLVAGAPAPESAGSVYSGAVLADGPFAYYRLNETGGPTAANIGSVGGGLNGTYNNASGFSFQQPSLLPGGDDFSIWADGATSGGGTEVQIPDDDALNTGAHDNKTVELWFQADSITSTRQVLYEQGGLTRGINLYVEEVAGTDTLFMGAWNLAESNWGPTFVSTPISENTPYHAVFVLDGDPDGNNGTDDGSVRGYLNAVSIGSATPAGNLRAHGDDGAAIGINQNTVYADGSTAGNGANFGGFVDELALYNLKLDDPNDDGNLTDSRVLAHYDAASVVSSPAFLSTDFTGRTVSGNTASNIPWTTNGVLDPGDLTAVDEPPSGALAGLFDTSDAQGHFAPDKNIGNEGPWSVTIPLTITAASVSLDEVVLDWQHFSNSGDFQGGDRMADWTVSVTGSVSGLLDSVTVANVGGTSGLLSLIFPTPLSLTPAETYALKIYVTGSNTDGNNTGLDAVTLNGVVSTIIPEPSTLLIWSLLAGLGLGVGWRRRRAG